MRNCKIEGCEKYEKTKGYCDAHYSKLRKYGDPLFSFYSKKDAKTQIVKRFNKGITKDNRYLCYKSMINRCHFTYSKDYFHYSNRKITVCERWRDKENGFKTFCEDMGDRPSVKHTIDRINNDLGYSKGNCKWATKHEQAKNRCNNNEVVGVHFNRGRYYRARLTVDKITYEKNFIEKEDAILYRKALELKYL